MRAAALPLHPGPRGMRFVGPLIVVGAMLLAVFMGLLINVMPWFIVIGLVVTPIVVVGSITNPVVGLLTVMALVFEAIPKSGLKLPIGGGGLELTDLLLIFLAAILLLRALVNRQQPLRELGPMLWPLLYLALCMVGSFFYVRGFAPNTAFLSEGRSAIMWLVLPILVMGVSTPARFRHMVTGAVCIGLLVALYVTLQSLFDIRIMTGARVEQLDARLNRDVTRSIAGGGIYLVVFSLYLVLNRGFEGRLRWPYALPMALLLVAGLGVQFGRGVWAATTVGLVVSAWYFSGFRGVLRVVLAGSLVVSLVLLATYAYKPRLGEALVERAAGIGAEIESGGSFNWRRLENQAALDAIARHPLTGVGIGGEYKQTTSSIGSFGNETIYIHNAYLYFPLKMGLLATFVPLAFSVAFVTCLRQGVRRHAAASNDRALIAALSGAFLVPVITSYTQPEWVSPQGIAALSIMMGLAVVYRRFGPWATSPTPPPQRRAGVRTA